MDLLNDLKNEVSYFNNQDTIFKNRDGFYKARAWARTRAYILKRDRNECQPCKDRGLVTTDNLIIHHIKPLEYRPDLSLEENNLITVCIGCHNFIHSNGIGSTNEANEWNDEYY